MLAIEEALQKAKESALPKKTVAGKFSVPQTNDQIPGKMYHSAKRVLVQETVQGKRMDDFRKEFEAKWGFSVDKIAHLIKV